MTRTEGRDDALGGEIEAVLLPGAPSEDEKADWVHEALGRADAMPPPEKPSRGRLILVGVAAAAVLLILGVLAFGPNGGWYDAHPVPEVTSDPAAPVAAIDEQRRVNEAALRTAEVQARLESAPEGSWAAIAAGRLIAITPSLDAVMDALKKTEWGTPPRQMFIFRVGTQGDVTYETTWPYEMVVGNAFLAETDLSFVMGPEIAAFWTGDRPPLPGEWNRFPSPDGRPFLPLEIRNPWAPNHEILMPTTFLVATGYDGPLILPEPTPILILLETPGLATVRDMTGKTRVFRRYVTRIVNEVIGLDVIVEALGDLRTPRPPVEIGNIVWERHRSSAVTASHHLDRPLALLAMDVSRGISTAPLEADGIREKLERFMRVLHVTPWTEPSGLSGEPFAAPAELVVYRPVGVEDPEMVLVGRVTVTEDSAGLIAELLDRTLERTTPTRLLFRLDPPADLKIQRELMAVLKKRLEGTGVTVGWLGGVTPNPIEVRIPGRCSLEIDEVIRRCTWRGKLEFRIVAQDGDATADGPLDLAAEAERRAMDPESYRPPSCPESDDPAYRWVRRRPKGKNDAPRWTLVRIDGWGFRSADLEEVKTRPDPSLPGLGFWIVSFDIVADRQNTFGEFTGGAVDRQMAIILDDELVTAPLLRSRLTNGGDIEGAFDQSEAEDLAVILKSGELPVRLTLIERR